MIRTNGGLSILHDDVRRGHGQERPPEITRQRRNCPPAVSIGLSFLALACGLACTGRSSPEVAYDHAYKTFLHGELKQSQEEAHRECLRFRDSSPEWAWKFRILEGESLLRRGLSQEALDVTELSIDATRDTERGR